MTNLGQECAMPLDLMHLHGAHTYIICVLALRALYMPAHGAPFVYSNFENPMFLPGFFYPIQVGLCKSG